MGNQKSECRRWTGSGLTVADTHKTAGARSTVVALFDDNIDAEHAMIALRKSERRPEQVSLIVRDRAGEREGEADRPGAITRALVDSALDGVGDWLQGLASLVVPEHGRFLVAGPMGAALASISATSNDTMSGGEHTTRSGPPVTVPPGTVRLPHTLTTFGFSEDEATYLEHRLEAGSTLIAVTASDTRQAQATRHLFADHQAVHISATETDEQVLAEIESLLDGAPETTQNGDVVVADAVAPLVHLCRADARRTSRPILVEQCGAEVVDRDGTEVGVVDDILTDAHPLTPGRNPEIRYVVIAFGGLLGIGRHHVAIPAQMIDFTQRPARVAVDRDVLHHGPDYDTDSPLSRIDERSICGYFGCTPYWSVNDEA